jgi:hypothetical protein
MDAKSRAAVRAGQAAAGREDPFQSVKAFPPAT